MKATELHKESSLCPCWVSGIDSFSAELTYFCVVFFPLPFCYFVSTSLIKKGKNLVAFHPTGNQYGIILCVQTQQLSSIFAGTFSFTLCIPRATEWEFSRSTFIGSNRNSDHARNNECSDMTFNECCWLELSCAFSAA